jgi:hypothetical protein
MTYSAKFSLVQNLCKSLFNLGKKANTFNTEAPFSIKISSTLNFSLKILDQFRRITHWDGEEIPPTFPYALLTHLHFSLVNDKNFPFSPYGLIHKRESIECFSPLTFGKWYMTCRIESLRKLERGFEMDIISELIIDKKLVWRSTSTAFKKTQSGVNQKTHEPLKVSSETHWNIPRSNGLAYGLITNNVDPIHLSKFTANLMGHKQAIMHGMWTCARGLSEYKDFHYPFTVNIKFISPIYLPNEVLYKKEGSGFGVYSLDGKSVHLLAEIIG